MHLRNKSIFLSLIIPHWNFVEHDTLPYLSIFFILFLNETFKMHIFINLYKFYNICIEPYYMPHLSHIHHMSVYLVIYYYFSFFSLVGLHLDTKTLNVATSWKEISNSLKSRRASYQGCNNITLKIGYGSPKSWFLGQTCGV